jgi:imidazolonepropionase-like amidohydrolase
LESATKSFVPHKHRPKNAAEIISRCRLLAMAGASSPNFHSRSGSDRFEEDTRPTLIQNARIWTGKKNGTEVVHADILLDKGLIKSIGRLRGFAIQTYGKELVIVDAKGSWVTPGLVDLHSHLGVDSLPNLGGSSDSNSLHGIVQPWLRSLDGLNTHDDSYLLSIAGGVTTSLVLPGSANAIGEVYFCDFELAVY